MPRLRHADPAPNLPGDFSGASSEGNSAGIRIEEFFDDPTLVALIQQAVGGNQELKILTQDVRIAGNEILARRGAYLPRFTVGGGAALNKYGTFTLEGAAIRDDPFRNGQFFPNPLPNFVFGTNMLWQVDIWRQLRNARDAATLRFFSNGEGRNYLVTRLVAEIAENYYGLMALDKRIENLNSIIQLQERSLEISQAKKEAARGTELAVQRFLAEVRKYQSEKLIVNQEIVQVENRINFLLGRFPQPIERQSARFFDLNFEALSVGVPAQLLQNRPDIRQAERALAAAGLDVKVARANFLPMATINSGVGYQAFNPKYLLFTPESLIYNVAGDLIAPLINKKAIQAEYLNANARQLQTIYNYQRTIINAVTEVVNRLSMVQKYSRSIEIKKQQVTALEESVTAATSLFRNPRAEFDIDYLDVLTAQNALFEARHTLIDTKREQLAAIVNTYQALGGAAYLLPVLKPETIQYDHKWFHKILADLHHPVAEFAPGGGAPPPAAEAPRTGPLDSPATPEALGAGPEPLPPLPGMDEKAPEPLPAPPAAGERSPFPPPAPAPETGQDPIPKPALDGGPGTFLTPGGRTRAGTSSNSDHTPS
jgi:NodT family efflux transporter outer membrane factor (OMF) lipoprotein